MLAIYSVISLLVFFIILCIRNLKQRKLFEGLFTRPIILSLQVQQVAQTLMSWFFVGRVSGISLVLWVICMKTNVSKDQMSKRNPELIFTHTHVHTHQGISNSVSLTHLWFMYWWRWEAIIGLKFPFLPSEWNFSFHNFSFHQARTVGSGLCALWRRLGSFSPPSFLEWTMEIYNASVSVSVLTLQISAQLCLPVT